MARKSNKNRDKHVIPEGWELSVSAMDRSPILPSKVHDPKNRRAERRARKMRDRTRNYRDIALERDFR